MAGHDFFACAMHARVIEAVQSMILSSEGGRR
jgi:hypothetical protein